MIGTGHIAKDDVALSPIAPCLEHTFSTIRLAESRVMECRSAVQAQQTQHLYMMKRARLRHQHVIDFDGY